MGTAEERNTTAAEMAKKEEEVGSKSKLKEEKLETVSGGKHSKESVAGFDKKKTVKEVESGKGSVEEESAKDGSVGSSSENVVKCEGSEKPVAKAGKEESKKNLAEHSAQGNKSDEGVVVEEDLEAGVLSNDDAGRNSSAASQGLEASAVAANGESEEGENPGNDMTAPGAVHVAGIRANETVSYLRSSISDIPSHVQQRMARSTRDLQHNSTTRGDTAEAMEGLINASANSPNGQHTMAGNTLVEATALDDIVVVQATPLREAEVQEQQRPSDLDDLQKQKPQPPPTRNRKILFALLLAILVVVIAAVASAIAVALTRNRIQSSDPTQQLTERDFSMCPLPEGITCIQTAQALSDAIQQHQASPKSNTMLPLCAGTEIQVNKTLFVSSQNFTLCCAKATRTTQDGETDPIGQGCILKGQEGTRILQVTGSSVHLIGLTFRMQFAQTQVAVFGNSTEIDSDAIQHRGMVNIIGGGTHVIHRCMFDGGRAMGFVNTGGSLMVEGPANVSVLSSTFENGFAATGGGGMFLNQGQLVEIKNCTFRNNTADYGGGFAVDQFSTVVIEDSTYLENVCEKSGGGGWMNASKNRTIVGNKGEGNVATRCMVFFEKMAKQCIGYDGNMSDAVAS